MRHPGAFETEPVKSYQMAPPPAGKWTGSKLDLIELIYAIQISVDHGKVSKLALQKAFEYIFQVKLGKIYDRFPEIIDRKKGDKPKYLEILIHNLNRIFDDLNK